MGSHVQTFRDTHDVLLQAFTCLQHACATCYTIYMTIYDVLVCMHMHAHPYIYMYISIYT